MENRRIRDWEEFQRVGLRAGTIARWSSFRKSQGCLQSLVDFGPLHQTVERQITASTAEELMDSSHLCTGLGFETRCRIQVRDLITGFARGWAIVLSSLTHGA